MDPTEFTTLRSFSDPASAEAARALLREEGIPAHLGPQDPISGPIASAQRGVRLFVPTPDADRARHVLADTDLTDRELGYLATGRLGPID